MTIDRINEPRILTLKEIPSVVLRRALACCAAAREDNVKWVDAEIENRYEPLFGMIVTWGINGWGDNMVHTRAFANKIDVDAYFDVPDSDKTIQVGVCLGIDIHDAIVELDARGDHE